jgi:hypothetical protein
MPANQKATKRCQPIRKQQKDVSQSENNKKMLANQKQQKDANTFS